MEVATFDPFSNKPNITPSSRKLYIHNLTKLNGGKPLKDFKFLSKPEEVLAHLENLKPNTRRTYLISIISALKDRPEAKYKKMYAKYYPSLENLNKSLKDQTVKSEKVKENWIEQSAVKEKLQDLERITATIQDKKKITADEYDELLKLVALSLYSLQQPRRNKDYIDMLIVRRPTDDTTHNYLDITNWNWIFNNYKTKKTYQQVILPVPDSLKKILEIYIRHHPLAKEIKKKSCVVPFLVHHDGSPLKTSTDMTRLLNKIFGKKIGCSLLRSIFLTDKYSAVQEELKKDADAMGTSTQTAENIYIKKD